MSRNFSSERKFDPDDVHAEGIRHALEYLYRECRGMNLSVTAYLVGAAAMSCMEESFDFDKSPTPPNSNSNSNDSQASEATPSPESHEFRHMRQR